MALLKKNFTPAPGITLIAGVPTIPPTVEEPAPKKRGRKIKGDFPRQITTVGIQSDLLEWGRDFAKEKGWSFADLVNMGLEGLRSK